MCGEVAAIDEGESRWGWGRLHAILGELLVVAIRLRCFEARSTPGGSATGRELWALSLGKLTEREEQEDGPGFLYPPVEDGAVGDALEAALGLRAAG